MSHIMEKEFSDVTVVIFTKDRVHLAKKVIEFWSIRNARVLVLDASLPENQTLHSTCDSLGAVYFWASSFSERAIFASENISTQFAVIHSDDSILFPKGVKEAIGILRQTNYSFVFSPANFTEYYLEPIPIDKYQYASSNWKTRVFQYSKYPNDFLWGAIWRTKPLCCALSTWGNSTSFIPFETGLHTISLYLSSLVCGSGLGISELIHGSRHWAAPIDESFQIAREQVNVYLLPDSDLAKEMLAAWKIKLRLALEELILVDQPLTEIEFDCLLNNLENSAEIRFRKSKLRKFKLRLKQKIWVEVRKKSFAEKGSFKLFSIVLKSRELYLLSINRARKQRVYWRASMLKGFSDDETLQFGIKVTNQGGILGEFRHFFPNG